MKDSSSIRLTESELKRIVHETVHEVFLSMGIRMDTSEAVIETQRDMQHLREHRLGVERVKKNGLMSIVTLLLAGLLTALWMGVKHMLGNN